MAYRQESTSVWDDIAYLLGRLYNAIRNGFASLAESIRQALARLGYYENTYA